MADHSRPVTGYPATNPQPQSNGYPSANTSYPYPNPHPYPNPNPYYNPNPNPNPYYDNAAANRRATLLRRIFAVIIAAVIITGTIIFIMWLVLRPRIPEFSIDTLNLTNFNVSPSSSLITGNWDVRFTVRNPNKKITLVYDRIQSFMFYRDDSLSSTTVPPFEQGTKNQTQVRASFAALSAYAGRRAVDGIASERTRGSISFNVRIMARVRFKAGAWRARRRLLRVLCGDLVVGVPSNGTAAGGGSLTGGPRRCRVGI
ncbi:hypothetical protein LguiA_021392 [Lonicera macranthoides]